MNRKSIALVISFVAIVVLTILSGAVMSTSIAESRFAKRYLESTQAFWLGEAGVNRALKELRDNPNLSGEHGPYSLGSGEYKFNIDVVGQSQREVTVYGFVPSVSATNRIRRELIAELDVGGLSSIFTYAAFGKNSVTMSGNGETDSYDSGQGPYGGGNVGSNGDVGTNGVEDGDIGLSGNATVNGDANTGPGGTVELRGNAKVKGEITHESEEDLPSITVPSELTTLSDGGNYTVSSNNTVTFSSGDYRFSSISISGNGKLNLEGTVNIYLTNNSSLNISGNGKMIIPSGSEIRIYTEGKCSIGGNGVVNNTNLPENFVLFNLYSGGGEGVKVTGNGDLYGAIYAPDTEIKISGNGDVYGSIVGSDLTITGNGDIHFDEALGGVEVASSRYTIQSWKDSQNMYSLAQ